MVTLAQPVNFVVLADQDLWDKIDAALTTLAVPQEVWDLIFELACQLNIAKAQPIQPVPASQPTVMVAGTLTSSKVKLEAPEKFDSNAQQLSNFLFQVRTYVEVLGISDAMEQIRLAITLLTGRALIWWQSVEQDGWATLGSCSWVTFEAKIVEQFRDLHHVMKMHRELSRLRQIASVQAYNHAFRNVYTEIQNEMSDADALFAYITGLKKAVQMQVMLPAPVDLLQAMSQADQKDSMMWFAGSHQVPWQPARHPQPLRPSPYQGMQTGYPRPGAGGGPGNPVPIELGAVESMQPKGFRDLPTVTCYNVSYMGHFACQCRLPRRQFQQQGQASIMTEMGIHFYQPYSALPPPPPPPHDANLGQQVPKNERRR